MADARNTRPKPACCCKAYRAATPVTVHVAIGTDTPHTHPAADPARDRQRHPSRFPPVLLAWSRNSNDGGVYLNVGSAVVLPEVFLKAVSAVRNLGHPLAGFHHREFRFPAALPPARQRGGAPARRSPAGKGYAITGHHEMMIPLLAAALIEKDS